MDSELKARWVESQGLMTAMDESNLASMNDEGSSFLEIAQYIEDYL